MSAFCMCIYFLLSTFYTDRNAGELTVGTQMQQHSSHRSADLRQQHFISYKVMIRTVESAATMTAPYERNVSDSIRDPAGVPKGTVFEG